MNIKQLIKKLRISADTLEELFIDKGNENKLTANKILGKRKKLHWTQMPKNKARLKELGKARRAKK